MRLVLDTNEYIFALGVQRKPSCERLVAAVHLARHAVRVERTIVREVIRNLRSNDVSAFFETLHLLLEDGCGIDEEFMVPHHLGLHYQDLGFKEGDAHFAAYAEVVEVDVLVSENRRHFHAMAGHLPFRVMDAEQFLKRYEAPR